jgi:flagellar motor switch protein FliM
MQSSTKNLSDRSSDFVQTDLRGASAVSTHIHELLLKLAGSIQHGLVRLSSRSSSDVELVDTGARVFEQFVLKQPDLLDISVGQCADESRSCAWIIDRSVVSNLVDYIFGGDASSAWGGSGKSYSTLELGIRQRLIDILHSSYQTTFLGHDSLPIVSAREIRRISNTAICRLSDVVVYATYRLKIGQGESLTTLFFRVDPLRESAYFHAAESGKQIDASRVERHSMSQTALQGDVVLCKFPITIAQLMSLSIGQILPINVDRAPVIVRVGGCERYEGSYGVRNGKYAVRITRRLLERGGTPDTTEDSNERSDEG